MFLKAEGLEHALGRTFGSVEQWCMSKFAVLSYVWKDNLTDPQG